MTTALVSLTSKLSLRLGLQDVDPAELMATLKATAFKTKDPVSDAQMTALMIVADQYGLNPWTKEIYAFPDKNNGIVPVVGVDGWSRIINDHKAFDGMEFEQDENRCTCIMYRKDRNHAIKISEYMIECAREGIGPWLSHPWRMLRHKAMIQCARVAFGFGGIYDQDEAERILEAQAQPKDMGVAERVQPEEKPIYWTPEKFAENLPIWRKAIAEGKAGKGGAESIITKAETKGMLTDAQKALIREPLPKAEENPEDITDVAPKVTYAQVMDKMVKAANLDALNEAADLIPAVADEKQRAELSEYFDIRGGELA